MNAHSQHTHKPSKAFRKWDTTQPYYVHPIWCATTIAVEDKLDRQVREDGILTLLYHDILEDTIVRLPEALSPQVVGLIKGMTFAGGNAEELIELWNRPPQIRLYKLYDKINNFLTIHVWAPPEKILKHREHACKLLDDVRKHYGELHITRIAAATLG